MRKIILITGGAGYVGNVVVRALLNKGYKVRVFDKLIFTKDSLRDIRDKIELVKGDIRNINSDIMDGVDGIIHLAGFSTEPTSQYNPRYTDLLNHIATEDLAKKAKQKGIKRFIFASSCSVYFTYTTSLNPKESKESDSVNPISPYSLSKRAAEQALLELTDENFRPTILRKGTIYGLSPRMRYDLVLNSFTKDAFLKRKLTVNAGGKIWRPMVDIQDIAQAYIKALELPLDKVGGKIFNVCSKNWNIGELAKYVQKVLKQRKGVDVDINIEPAGITRNYKSSNLLFNKIFQYSSIRTLAEAALEIWDHLEKNPKDGSNSIYYNDKWEIQLMEAGQL